MIPVLKNKLALSVGDDDRGWFPALLCQFVHFVDAIVPVVVVNRAQHRVARWSGQPMQLIERQFKGPGPPAQLFGQLLGEDRVVAARTGKESTYPVAQLLMFSGCSGALN